MTDKYSFSDKKLEKDDVHDYGQWLIKTKQAVSSWHDINERTDQFQKLLLKNGYEEYQNEVAERNKKIKSTLNEDDRSIFFTEQEMHYRTIGGESGTFDLRNKTQLEQEIIIGLGKHKNVSILDKEHHAPIPWEEVISSKGKRMRDQLSKYSLTGSMSISLSKEFGDDGYGACQLLDATEEHVLFNSSKRERLFSILHFFQPFYIPKRRDVILKKVCAKPKSKRKDFNKINTWKNVISEHKDVFFLFPRAFMSWFIQYMNMQILSLEKNKQAIFLKMLLQIDNMLKHDKSGKRNKKVEEMPSIVNMTVCDFYSTIKREFGLSTHIIDKDPEKNIAVISFEITHRYHLAIFLDTNPITIEKLQFSLCMVLFDYLCCIYRNSQHLFDIEKYRNVLWETLHYIVQINKISDDRIKRRNINMRKKNTEKMFTARSYKKKNKQMIERKHSILKMNTSGIIDIAIYPCTCKRFQ